MTKIVLHLKASDLQSGFSGWHLEFYQVLGALMEAHGIRVESRQRDGDIRIDTRTIRDSRFDDGNLHIIDDRSVRAPNVLNAGVAYFWRFWQLDPRGVKAFSSTGDTPYEPDQMPRRRAQSFFDNMHKRYVRSRKSKYDQPETSQQFPEGAISVFFQGDYPVTSGATSTTDIEMLRAVQSGAGDRRIIVKPHPLTSNVSDIAETLALAEADNRIIVTDANVHDILSASCATVSINSTVALEGFLHRKPAILFGRSDFHHLAGQVHDPQEFSRVLADELDRDEGYEQFLAWYFLKMCLPLSSARLEERIWQIFTQAGFPRARFM
ncbi:capsular polysaccharide export protein, LipB/KpsS family [Phycobacter sp. K97]|uniref:capsular polysaccharide export protein, LipB/KpsS family n=1 Tax=Phycobacter sedimenti TaxID=3133977 RepID=UPI00311DD302